MKELRGAGSQSEIAIVGLKSMNPGRDSLHNGSVKLLTFGRHKAVYFWDSVSVYVDENCPQLIELRWHSVECPIKMYAVNFR